MLRRISSAHVVSVIALVFAIGGGTAVALKGKNTVDGGDIKANAIKSSDVKADALTGADIDESSLSLSAPASKCPAAAPTRVGDVCFGAEQPGTDLLAAFDACFAQGLRLPSAGEAGEVVRAVGGTTLIWTDDFGDPQGLRVSRVSDSDAGVDPEPIGTATAFRCVIGATVD